ncbi:MAG: hypothetical protein HYU37_20835 [Acidobacteria bacterium]|nr:hypothetical protein [Acidobacteriota bacterium]
MAAGVRLTLGAKVEHNSYSGTEAEPSIRANWMPTERQALWGAVTRAVRTSVFGEMAWRF